MRTMKWNNYEFTHQPTSTYENNNLYKTWNRVLKTPRPQRQNDDELKEAVKKETRLLFLAYTRTAKYELLSLNFRVQNAR